MTLHIERPVAKPGAPPFRERRGLPAVPPIRLAHIVSVSGSHAVAIMQRQEAVANEARVQIGTLIKIVTPTSAVMGVVSAISAPMPAAEGEPQSLGLLEINLAGEVMPDHNRRLTFRRGVSGLSTPGDAVLLADKHDLTRVYPRPRPSASRSAACSRNPAFRRACWWTTCWPSISWWWVRPVRASLRP
jgi:uncharacterized protein